MSAEEERVFSDSLRAELARRGENLGGALRQLRPGAPLDQTYCVLRCTGCGASGEHPLRWYYDRDFRCTCGAAFDGEPLRESLRRIDADDPTPVPGIRFIIRS